MYRDQAGTRFRIESFRLIRVWRPAGSHRTRCLPSWSVSLRLPEYRTRNRRGQKMSGTLFPPTFGPQRCSRYKPRQPSFAVPCARNVTPKPPAAILTPGTAVRVVTFVRCDQKLMRDITSITTAYVAAGLVLCQASWQISDHELCEGDARTCCQTHVCGIPSRHPATRCRSPSLWAGLR
jgi:hypothetical protein